MLRATLMTLAVTVASMADRRGRRGGRSAAAKLSGSRDPARRLGMPTRPCCAASRSCSSSTSSISAAAPIVTRVAAALLGIQGFLGVPSFLAGLPRLRPHFGGLSGGSLPRRRAGRAARPDGGRPSPSAWGRACASAASWSPQIVAVALPGLGNVWQLALKESALISVTGPRRAAAPEPDRRRFDASALQLLHRGGSSSTSC